jgi:hypothetical protein
MNKDNVNQILDALSARLGTPAAHLWAVLVRQAAVEFWTNTAIAVVLAMAFTFYTRWVVRHEWDSYSDSEMFAKVGVAVLGGFTLIGICIAVSQVGYLVNPEYYALRTVLGAFK